MRGEGGSGRMTSEQFFFFAAIIGLQIFFIWACTVQIFFIVIFFGGEGG